jgi:hypothetical protein
MGESEFKQSAIVRHGSEAITWKEYECATDGFMRDAVHHRAVDDIDFCIIRMRVLSRRLGSTGRAEGEEHTEGQCPEGLPCVQGPRNTLRLPQTSSHGLEGLRKQIIARSDSQEIIEGFSLGYPCFQTNSRAGEWPGGKEPLFDLHLSRAWARCLVSQDLHPFPQAPMRKEPRTRNPQSEST